VKRRTSAAWIPATVTVFCAWCFAPFRDMTLAQVHAAGRTTLRCASCGSHNVLPNDLLTHAENVPTVVDPDNPPGRAEAWERLVGNRTLKRAMEIAIAGRHTLAYVGHADYGWSEVKDIMGEWVIFAQRCLCGNYMRYNRVACSCTYDEIEAHRKTRPFAEALDSDLIAEAHASDEYEFWETTEPYAAVLARVEEFRLSQAFGGGPHAEWTQVRHMGDTPSFKLLNEHKTKWGLTPQMVVSVQRVAHTIAGLEGSRLIEPRHMAEALMFKAPLQDT
jgi:predicted ATPase with chaperone activity